ncbi:alpha/beta fold hydrolase [Granulicella cerasi]|uniref:Alpha/beta fold hydrolase n=1 Tax=Granulicella cerasi TaxID=741063 RepID=A0ABW1ZAH4_9BACT|nr:alpha/beta hydrolase [Granulicella cerasi]
MKPPILLIPGLLCTAELYAAQIPVLSACAPVTVANTLEGATMESMAAAILREAPPRFALAGISMGGYLSMEIWRQAPERVERMALIDTTARADTPEQTMNRRKMMERAQSEGLEPVIEQMIAATLHPLHQSDERLRASIRRMAEAVGVEAYLRQQEAIMTRVDSRPLLPTIAVPTLVLVGDRDLLTPVERAREMADAMPQAKLVVVPEAAHGSVMEQPEFVNRALLEWLSA